jgi:hypothetical protein
VLDVTTHQDRVQIGRHFSVTFERTLSGKPYHKRLEATHQDYAVAPPQPWLDGVNAGDGFIKQFVAMLLGQGYTVEGQATGEETHGGLQLVVFDPKPGRFPDSRPSTRASMPGAPER